MKPKVTIIIPVFNIESYLRRCLDSIVAQTFLEWECILVDDGSTDRSGSICDDYMLNDSRFEVIHKQNGGVSSARNCGMAAAKGEWITFIDGDDFVSPSFIEELYAPITKDYSLSFVHGGCVNYFENGHTSINQQFEFYKGNDKSLLFESFRGLVFSKLFKKEIINKQSIRFDERIKIAEDYIFTLEYIFYVDNFVLSNSIGYYYYMRIGSATKSIPTFNDGMWIGPKRSADLTYEYIQLFSPKERAILKRMDLVGRSISSLLLLYKYDLSECKRKLIFAEFRNTKYLTMIKKSHINCLKRIVLLGLISKRMHSIFSGIMSFIIRRNYSHEH